MFNLSLDLAAMLAEFGYPAIVAITLVGGQAVVPVAGFLAQQGYLSPWHVGLSAFGGSLICNQGLFFLARFRGGNILRRLPRLTGKIETFGCRMRKKHQVLLMLGFPFLYGFRNITPVFLGLTSVPAKLFFPLNCVAAAAWAAFFTGAGFFFGKVLSPLAGQQPHFEYYVTGGIIALAAIAGAARLLKRKRDR